MNAVLILRELCKNKNYYSASGLTKRIKFIIEVLNTFNLRYSVDIFEIYNKEFVNIIIEFKASDPTVNNSVVFFAHHNVKNVSSDNCNDNSAAVAILLSLCDYVDVTKLRKNLLIVFTDDGVNRGLGAKRLCKQIMCDDTFANVECVINLERAAVGDTLCIFSKNDIPMVISRKIIALLENDDEIAVFNDSFFVETEDFVNNKIPCFTMSLLPHVESDKYMKHNIYPDSWRKAHTILDKYSDCNTEIVSGFYYLLKKFVT